MSIEMQSITCINNNDDDNNNIMLSSNNNSSNSDDDDDDDDNDENQKYYIDPSSNDLGLISGAALIIADCMGTGILALPYNINITLGKGFGLFFLLLNVLINLYAGTILCNVALLVENNRIGRLYTSIIDNHNENSVCDDNGVKIDRNCDTNENNEIIISSQKELYHSMVTNHNNISQNDLTTVEKLTSSSSPSSSSSMIGDDNEHEENNQCHEMDSDAQTFDFIGMTNALFNCPNNRTKQNQSLVYNNEESTTSIKTRSKAIILVTVTYYTNIFLVLGNYILVMSHAVAAMIGEENICLPNAGLIASTLMFGLCQLRSMSSLGRSVSFISLLALGVVVIQCLVSIQSGNNSFMNENGLEEFNGERMMYLVVKDRRLDDPNVYNTSGDGIFQSLARQFTAISSIGFAVGSQKLLLNIRHEFKDRTQAAPQSLGISLFAFGSVYALVCIMSGPNPPSFLFDAVSAGNGRRLAGFLLWIHVAVSFAINSQALCSSIDRIKFHNVTIFSLHKHHRLRWAILTFLVSISSFFIANAIPFFKDLVSLIGALTSVPLTLLLPAIYHRKIRGLPLCFWSFNSYLRRQEDIWSFLLVAFSVIFLICGVAGSLSSIEIDWSQHGPPFSCH